MQGYTEQIVVGITGTYILSHLYEYLKLHMTFERTFISVLDRIKRDGNLPSGKVVPINYRRISLIVNKPRLIFARQVCSTTRWP